MHVDRHRHQGVWVSLVQTKLLQVAIRALHSQQSVCGETVKSVGIQGDQPAVPTGATSGDMSDATASTGADVITPCDPPGPTKPRDAADQRPVTIADLRRQADNDQQLFGSGKTLDVLLGVEHAPDRPTVSAPSNQSPSYEFDPRTILTVKAATKKAVHITQFLSEATRKKRQTRRKQFVLGQRSSDSELVITSDDDHLYSGITIEEWGAANARIMAHLLHTGQLLPQHIDYYIAYTVQIGYSPLFRRSIFPKVHCFEGSLFRRFTVPKKRFIVPKVYWSDGSFIRNRGSLLRRFIVPKVHCSEIEVHCSEGSFIRNRGSLLRRLIIPKVQYSEISHLSDRNMLICYDKYEMIRIFGRATIVHIQAKLGKEMVHEMNQMTLFSRHRIRTLAVLRSLPLGHRGFPQYLVLRMDGEKNVAMTIKIL